MILKKIITEKRKEISKIKTKETINELKDRISTSRSPKDFKRSTLMENFQSYANIRGPHHPTGPISSKD